MLDDCCDLESIFFEEGRTQGAIDAEANGIERGRIAAKSEGRKIGMEVGFYIGCTRVLMSLAKDQDCAIDKRCVTPNSFFLDASSANSFNL